MTKPKLSDFLTGESITESLELAGVSITLADISKPDMPLVYVNEAFTKLTGYEPEEVIGQNCRFLQKNKTPSSSLNTIHNAFKNEQSCHVTLLNFSKSGKEFINRLTLIPIQSDGQLRYYLGIQREMPTHDTGLLNALAESQDNLMTLISYMSEGVVFHDQTGAITNANPAAQKILGLSLNQIKGLTALDPRWESIHEDGSPYPGEQHPVMRVIKTGETVINDIMGIRHVDGELRWLSINATTLLKKTKSEKFYLAMFSDITEEKKLDYLAKSDELTGLYNRRYFNLEFNDLLKSPNQLGYQWFFAISDIDWFKKINDNFGHAKGDEVLMFIGGAFQKLLDKNQPFYNFRLGGEEFGSLFEAKDMNSAVEILESLQNRIGQKILQNDDSDPIQITMSIGLCQCVSTEAIRYHFQKADQALYSAKQNGRNQIVIAQTSP